MRRKRTLVPGCPRRRAFPRPGCLMHSLSPLTAANFLLILFVCATGGIGFAQNRPPDSTQSKYVGADACQGCHEDQHKSFSASSHVATLKKEQLSQRGCEGCHGP